ncbi:Vacuolar protein sorting-associated protein 29 [Geranomyces variabilis]|nr:Vacuolar protein sorting-associated protein 29 [Geranomyces variabilis]
MDEQMTPGAALSRIATHGPLRIGVIQGHQVVPWGDARALGIVARDMDVDVLISGHTHRFEAFEHDRAARQGPMVVLYVYQLIDGDVRVEKLDSTKRL